jgi:hypothetical protein
MSAWISASGYSLWLYPTILRIIYFATGKLETFFQTRIRFAVVEDERISLAPNTLNLKKD